MPKKLLKCKFANSLGPVNVAAPFQLFGATPLTDSCFFIDSAEWLNIPITNINLTIKWDNIPPNFTHYYKDYSFSSPCTNSSFKVNIYVLYQGNWQVLNARPLNLFQQTNGMIKTTTVFNLKVSSQFFRMTDNEVVATQPFQNPGTLMIKLVQPTEGFGSALYGQAVSTAALLNANAASTQVSNLNPATLLKPMPNHPYSPLVKQLDISIGY